MTIVLRFYRLAIYGLMLCNSFAWSASVQAQAFNTAATTSPAASPQSLTVSRFMDHLEAFENEEDEIERELQGLPSFGYFKIQINHLAQNFEDFEQEFFQKQSHSSWNALKIDHYLSKFAPIYDTKESLKAAYLNALRRTENLSARLTDQKAFFQNSAASLNTDPIIRRQSGRLKNISDFLNAKSEELSDYRNALTQLYQRYDTLFRSIEEQQEELEASQAEFREVLFSQTQVSFFSRDFFLQQSFEPALRRELATTWQSFTSWDSRSWQIDWVIYLWIVLIVLGAWAVFRHLKIHYDFHQPPGALSLLLGILTAQALLEAPPPWLVVLTWALLPYLLYQVVKTYQLPNQASKFLLKLFIAFALLKIVEAVDLPMVLYRIFLASFAGLVGVYSLLRHRYALKHQLGSVWKHWVAVPVGIAFLLALVVELAGYHLLASWLIQGMIKSAFLIFALIFFRHFSYDLLNFFSHLPFLDSLRFINRHRAALLQQLSRVLQVLMIVAAVLILPTLWQLYPNMGAAAEHILSWGVTIGEKRITFQDLLEAVLFFYAAHLVAFFLCALLQDEVYPRKQIERGVANSINSLVRYSLWFIGITIAFFALGFELKQLALIAGALSVGIGFGLQNIVNNFVSGIILLFERPVKVGDLLEVGDEWGEVEKVGLRSTIIRTYSKTQLIIPNSEFITQKVTNLTLSDPDYRILIPVGIAYGSDTKKAQAAMLKIVQEHPLVKKHPQPLVLFDEFGNSSLNFKIYLWVTDAAKKFVVISDILFAVDQAFRELGVEIPFPQRDLHLRSVSEGSLKDLNPK